MLDRIPFACLLVVMLCALTRNHARADPSPREPRGGSVRADRPLSVAADLVIGRGETLTLGRAVGDARASRGRADVECASLVVAAEYAITPAFGAGVQLPLTLIRVLPEEATSRVTFAPGNLVLEAELEVELAAGFELNLALVVALPTARGRDLPSSDALAARPELGDAQRWDAYDAFAAQRAATSVRGHEEDPLFEPDHLGFVPTVSLDYRSGAFALHAYLEFENLIRTQSQAAAPYIGEIDVGIHARYIPSELVELALKGWTNAGLVGESDFIAAVEPQLRLHLERWDLSAGLVVPFTGDRLDTSFIGVRLVALAHL